MNPLLLEHLTWPEVEAALEAGSRTVIIACGAVEQHGPHLPLFVDAEHGTALALRVAQRMGGTLVAPTIRVGVSEHHMGFAGTVSITESTFHALCHDYTVSMARHGFTRICFLPTHGGNFRPLAAMADALDETAGPDATVIVYTDLLGLIDLWRQMIEDLSGLGDRVGGHADIAETALMEYLHPDLVRRDKAEAGYQPELSEDVVERIIRDGFKSITPNGIMGDARGATAEMGERCIDALADVVAAYFKHA